MSDRLEFRGKLQGILELAESQERKITLEEVETYFEEEKLSREQIELVCDYLLSQKVAVSGYEKSGGVLSGPKQEEPQEEQGPTLTEEEQKYVESYLEELREMKAKSEEEARLLYYFPKVVELAVKVTSPQVFVGDVIQEGNVSLMLALRESSGRNDRAIEEQAVLEQVRAGMLALVEAQTEVKRQDKKMVEQVSELDETIQSMSEEMGRKVAVDEVAEKLGISEDQIADILKLAGEELDGEEDE